MKAYIKKDKGKSRWLIVERGDTSEKMAYSILEDEIEAIMFACIDYIAKKED